MEYIIHRQQNTDRKSFPKFLQKLQRFRETISITGFSACSFADLFALFYKKYTDVHKNGK